MIFQKLIVNAKQLAYKKSRVRFLTRSCCLGNRVIARYKAKGFGWINNQKYRLDHLSESPPNHIRLAPADTNLFTNKQLLALAVEQNYLHLFNSSLKPDFVVIDSFSDLTDRLFITNSGSAFFAHFSDLSSHVRTNLRFQSGDKSYIRDCGLMDLSDYSMRLKHLVELLWSFHGPNIPIIFLNMPSCLETREVYRHRAQVILADSISLAASLQSLYAISVEDGSVAFSEGDTFPYHYDDETIDAFCDKIELLNLPRFPRSRCS